MYSEQPEGRTCLSVSPGGAEPQCGPSSTPGICPVPLKAGGTVFGSAYVHGRKSLGYTCHIRGKTSILSDQDGDPMHSPHPNPILTPLPSVRNLLPPISRFPDTQKASYPHFWFSPLGTFDRETLFSNRENSLLKLSKAKAGHFGGQQQR